AKSVQGELSALIEEGSQAETSGLKEVVSYVQEQKTEKFNQQFRADMDNAVKVLQEAIPEEQRKLFTPDVLEGHLYQQAETRQDVKEAFLQRGNNPQAWTKIQAELAKEFSKRFEDMPDPGINEDREAVMAAAKTQPGKTTEEELTLNEIRKLPSDKWQKMQSDLGVKPYGT
ncbi:MAG: hypothetical protein ACR2QM_07805, partial [Longimicrobiales bacterium]